MGEKKKKRKSLYWVKNIYNWELDPKIAHSFYLVNSLFWKSKIRGGEKVEKESEHYFLKKDAPV